MYPFKPLIITAYILSKFLLVILKLLNKSWNYILNAFICKTLFGLNLQHNPLNIYVVRHFLCHHVHHTKHWHALTNTVTLYSASLPNLVLQFTCCFQNLFSEFQHIYHLHSWKQESYIVKQLWLFICVKNETSASVHKDNTSNMFNSFLYTS